MNKHVHRTLHFGDPTGADAHAFELAVGRELHHRKLGFLVRFKTPRRGRHSVARCVFALGLSDSARKAVLGDGHVGKWTQRKIRNPKLRSPLDRVRERRRKPTLRKWRAMHRHADVKTMFDDVVLDLVPADAEAVAGYTGGAWPTFGELDEHFPKARRLSIAISASEDADCLDVEPGDASPADAPGWVRRQLERRHHDPSFYNQDKPTVYGSASQGDEIRAVLDGAGIARSAYFLWTAHYTFEPHLCGPDTCGEVRSTEADATQWTDLALGRSLDQSVLTPQFFN